jgi:hypothetical protein
MGGAAQNLASQVCIAASLLWRNKGRVSREGDV